MNRILIYDDEQAVCDELRQMLMKIYVSDECDIMTAVNRSQAEGYLADGADLVFLDIVLDDEDDGIAFAKYMREKYPAVKLVFITAHIRYCEEIFEASPDGFLVKPFTVQKVKRSLDILKRNSSDEDALVFRSSKSNITRVPADRVAYIESFSRKLMLYNENGEKIYEFSGSKLSAVEQQLPGYFLRCHHSFCVNLNFVSDLKRYSFTLKNADINVPVSQNRFKETKEKYLTYLGGLI